MIFRMGFSIHRNFRDRRALNRSDITVPAAPVTTLLDKSESKIRRGCVKTGGTRSTKFELLTRESHQTGGVHSLHQNVSKVDQYYHHARVCQRKAEEATDAETRKFFLDLRHRWMLRATGTPPQENRERRALNIG